MDDDAKSVRLELETVRAELDRIKQAASIAGVGFWEWNLAKDVVVVNQPSPDGDHIQTVTDPRTVVESIAHPEDLPRIQEEIRVFAPSFAAVASFSSMSVTSNQTLGEAPALTASTLVMPPI